MIDSHAHLKDPQFDTDREQVATRSPAWIEIGTTAANSAEAIELAEQYPQCWATVGVHPDEIATLNEQAWAALEKLVAHPKVKAVGEVGFDFYRDGKHEEQEPVLKKFIGLANKKELPIVFHVRDGKEASAHEALLALLESLPSEERPAGVIHTFSGSLEQAQRYLSFGLHLSFSGVLTFKKAGEIVEVAKTMPLEKMLIETDCPYLTPEPYRGQRNEPAYVKFVAEKIAELRNMNVEEVVRITEENTKKLFQLSTAQFS